MQAIIGIGCVITGIVSLYQDSYYLLHENCKIQLLYQLISMIVTCAIAITYWIYFM